MSHLSNRQGRVASLIRLSAASAAVVVVAGSFARATDYNFNGPVNTAADYSIAGNWLPAAVPTAGDAAFIFGGRIASVNAGFTGSANSLSLGANGSTGTGELRVNGGSLTVAGAQIGHDAGTDAGLLTLNSGAFTSTGNVVLGEQGTGDNKIVATGGTLTLGGETYLGANAKGSLAVSGTAVVNTHRLDIGNSPNSIGAVTVTGGMLNDTGNNPDFDFYIVGLRGLGSYTQTGGIANLNRMTAGLENDGPVGGPSGDGKGKGVIAVSGGALNVAANVVIGEQSREDNQLNVSGGTATFNSDVYNGAHGRGTINVSGTGTLNIANQMHIGAENNDGVYQGNGVLNVTGGNLNMTGGGGWILVGQYGTGVFNFSGGAIDTKIISIGQEDTSHGSAVQTGGSLRSQGTLVVGEVSVANSTYDMSAGTADIGTTGLDPDGSGIFVGSYRGKGTYTIRGTAAVSVRDGITIGYGEGGASDGTLNLADTATLTTINADDGGRVRIGVYGGSVGKLNINGGTATFAGPILNGVARGGVGVGGQGIVTVNGGSLTAQAMTNETGSTFNQLGGTSSLGVVTGGGSMSVSAGTANVARISQLSLSVTGTGTVKVANAATPTASVVGSLTTGGTGKLDLTNNGLIIDYTSPTPTPIANIRAALLAGRITATLTPADARQGVAYAEASSIGLTSLLGTPVDTTAVVLQSRLKGDTDLSGKVDFTDLLALAQHYNTTGGSFWTTGDFNYDGNVGFDDLLALAQNYNSNLLSGDIGSASFQADWALAQSLVPEPTSLLAIASIGMLAGRRRRD